MRDSEATKASYLRANFLTSFLFLLSFFKSSADMASTPPCLARSRSCWSPKMLRPSGQPQVTPRRTRLAIPDGHVGAGNRRQLDGARETLVALRIIVLEADLELDRLEEVALLGIVGILQELLDLRPDISCGDGLAEPSSAK